MSSKLSSTLAKLLFSTFLAGLSFVTTIEVKADNQIDLSNEDVEMKEENDSSETESGENNNINNELNGEPVVTIPEIEEGKIKLMAIRNKTDATINFQRTGDPGTKTLQVGEMVMMQEVSLPVVIRIARPDNGFLVIKPMINDLGLLEISLDEATERNPSIIKIEQDGRVYINDDSKVGADLET